MPRPIWGDLPQIVVKAPPKKPVSNKKSPEISQVLNEANSTKFGVINLLAMEKKKMKPLFKGFNPEQVTPKALSKAGMMLYSNGFIDNHMVELLSRAGAEFDKKGEIVNPDQEVNALEFFAGRIADMKKKASTGDPYARILMPDYIKAVHVLQNLHTFASTGTSAEMMAFKKAQKEGKKSLIPKSFL